MLLSPDAAGTRDLNRACTHTKLEKAGLSEKIARRFAQMAQTPSEFYQLDRAAHLLQSFIEEGMLPHVAQGIIRRALDAGMDTDQGVAMLDTFEIALETCRKKKHASQNVSNPAGLIVKLIRDQEAEQKLISADLIEHARHTFRQREKAAMALLELEEQRSLVIEYERYREETARVLYDEMSESARAILRREKAESLKQQPRFDKLDAQAREREVAELVYLEIAKRDVPPFEKWYMRRRARQALLEFEPSPTTVCS
jgi:hypothetical protein